MVEAGLLRLNRVRIATEDGDFDLDWSERDELLDLMRGVPGGDTIIWELEGVGSTGAAELTDPEKALVVWAVAPAAARPL